MKRLVFYTTLVLIALNGYQFVNAWTLRTLREIRVNEIAYDDGISDIVISKLNVDMKRIDKDLAKNEEKLKQLQEDWHQ